MDCTFVHPLGKIMKIIRILAVAAGLSAFSFACVAQEDEKEAPPILTYSTYFNCPGGPLKFADAEIASTEEAMDALVKEGTMLSWGYLSHHTGGHWQRAIYFQAQGMDALLDAYDAAGAIGGNDDAEDEKSGDPNFGEVCNNHEDYIWQAESGSKPGPRGDVGFSVYFKCDSPREERADELVESYIGPIFDKLVADGKLTSWGWLSHQVGGEFRRLNTMTGKDFKSLMAARGEAIELIYAEGNAEGAEFGEICNDHVDYLWNIVHETP